jgi:3'(2'), 5'-bisphosphate nucleotidase
VISRAWREEIEAACREAARAICLVRGETAHLDAARKQDGTLVSTADHAASRIIGERLAALDADIPVICEEGAHDPAGANRFWLVDPLDGTREFLRGGDAFSINVALVEDTHAVFGMVHLPVGGISYWGGSGLGAWHEDRPIRVRSPREAAGALRVLVSPGEAEYAHRRCAGVAIAGHALQVDPMPGVIKFCLIASGEADFYPRNATSCAWDAAAGHAILRAAGGEVLGPDWRTLRYRPTPRWYNGPFVALSNYRKQWRQAFAVW